MEAKNKRNAFANSKNSDVNGRSGPHYEQPKPARSSTHAHIDRFYRESISNPSSSETAGPSQSTAFPISEPLSTETEAHSSTGAVKKTGATSKTGSILKTGPVPKTGAIKKTAPTQKTGAIPKTGALAKTGPILKPKVIPKTATNPKTGAVPKTGANANTGAIPKTGASTRFSALSPCDQARPDPPRGSRFYDQEEPGSSYYQARAEFADESRSYYDRIKPGPSKGNGSFYDNPKPGPSKETRSFYDQTDPRNSTGSHSYHYQAQPETSKERPEWKDGRKPDRWNENRFYYDQSDPGPPNASRYSHDQARAGPASQSQSVRNQFISANSKESRSSEEQPSWSSHEKFKASSSKNSRAALQQVKQDSSSRSPSVYDQTRPESTHDDNQSCPSRPDSNFTRHTGGHWITTSGSSNTSRSFKSPNDQRPYNSSAGSGGRPLLQDHPHLNAPRGPPDRGRERSQSSGNDDSERNDVRNQNAASSHESEEDPPANVIVEQPRLAQRQSTVSDPTYPTDSKSTKSTNHQTSTDSGTQAVEAEPSHNTSADRVQRPNFRGRLYSYVIPTADSILNLSPGSPDRSIHHEEIFIEELNFHQRRPNNLIDPRLQYDICTSIPVCSGNRRRQNGHNIPSVHQPSSRGRDRWSIHQQPLPDRYFDRPPSPAPRTPIKSDEHFYNKTSNARHKKPNKKEGTIPWTFEDFERLSYRKFAFDPGPRLVTLKGSSRPGSDKFEDYELQDQAAALPPRPQTYRQSYYGAESPSRPFRSYLGSERIHREELYPEPTATTFVRNVYEKYYSNREETTQSMPRMNPLEDYERKIIIEFCHLLEKSKQLFNGLRELPQYGHKQWSLYFGRTFDIYTRLWKYQQQHRAVLDSKYGMKRWQIGEIASKIGQLYYHFYLRTSETAYLNEAFSFYYAIRGRCYYTKANKEDKCELMVKKLRYYARFIVVCLLLNKMKLVKELIKELERQIIEYGNTYDPDDQVEWTVVVDEVKAFVHAEPVVSVVNPDNQTMILSHRMSPMTTPPVERTPQMTLSLQEILIVGSSTQQVKFSELTMDMFRMLQTLEREPSGDVQHIFDESPRQRFMAPPNASNQEGLEQGQKYPNPHKYLLYKPSPGQMLVYLSSGINDLPPNSALLVYLSADGHTATPTKHTEDGYDVGGLITTSKNDIYRECNKDPKPNPPAPNKHRELNCLYPGDLYPFTRRPLFLIVDSDNSYAFQNMPRHFGQPLIILMSPLDMPPSYHDPRRQGSMFTLFLHSPLEGLCYSCDLSSVTLALWDRAQMLLDTFMAEASTIFVRSRVIDPVYITFFGDDFFRLLILRYVFCEATLRLHRLFRGRTHLTRCTPMLPDDLFEHPTLIHIIMDIANVLQIRNHIQEPPPMPSSRDTASGGN